MSAVIHNPPSAAPLAVLSPNAQARTHRHNAGLFELHAFIGLDQLAEHLRGARRGRRGAAFGLRLGDLLLGHSLVTPAELADALAAQHATRRRLGEILVERGLLTADTLKLVLGEQFGFAIVDLKRFPIQPDALHRIPRETCLERGALPIAVIDGRLVVAIADPVDSRTMRVVEFAAHAPVDFVIADGAALRETLRRLFGGGELERALAGAAALPESEDDAPEGVISMAELEADLVDQPIVKLLNHLLLEAIRRNASDVHLRPELRGLDVLFRIDGQIVHVRTLARGTIAPLVARVKVVARMDLANQFTPQDGSARVVNGDSQIDLRFSVIPTSRGPSVTVRILNSNLRVNTFDDLGFTTEDIHLLHDAVHRSSGLVLVTGPTGAGKSTTLYAALREIVKRKVTVMSVEDPVERQVAGVEQIQINTAQGLTFPRALRSMLRHDPDAIMVGEVRDAETAKLAFESALTGHLVLSTLHTNSAAAAVTRLMDMGLEPYVIASTLKLVVAQRLVRLNCSYCLTAEVIPEQVRKSLGLRDRERFARGVGCHRCDGTGYAGRQVVYEILPMSEPIREAAIARASSAVLQRIAVDQGMVTLDQRAIELARNRRISIAEAYRVRLG